MSIEVIERPALTVMGLHIRTRPRSPEIPRIWPAFVARIPAGMESLVIPAGEWASFRYPLSRLGEGFGEIFGTLLPQSGFEQSAGPYFERYDEAFCPDEPQSLVQICLPVRRRKQAVAS